MQPDHDRILRDARRAFGEPDADRVRRAAAAFVAGLDRKDVRRRRTGVALLAAALVLAAALAAVAAERATGPTAAAPAVRVVDRTFVCTPERSYAEPGAREFRVDNWPALRHTPAWTDPWIDAAHLVLDTGTLSLTSRFVVVRAHARPAQHHVGWHGPAGAGVFVNTARCSPTRATVPLAPPADAGAPIRYGRTTKCTSPGRVLVRVRATLAAPTRWTRLRPPYDGVQRNVSEARIAVRAQGSGRALALTRLQGTQTAVWLSGRCS